MKANDFECEYKATEKKKWETHKIFTKAHVVQVGDLRQKKMVLLAENDIAEKVYQNFVKLCRGRR